MPNSSSWKHESYREKDDTVWSRISNFHEIPINAIKTHPHSAKTGINLTGVVGNKITKYAKRLTQTLYRGMALPLDYLGLDGYFGIWQPEAPESRIPYIATMHGYRENREA